MINSLCLYFKSCRMLIRSQMQYRASFLMQTFTQLVMMVTELLAVLILMDRFSVLGRWNRGEILFFFGVISTSFYLCECFARGITQFPPLIAQGDLDSMLIRPRGVLFQVICSRADPRRFGAILIGVLALILGSVSAQIHWTAFKMLLLIWTILGGMALVCGLFLIEATLSFFSVKRIELVNILTYGGRSTCQYPIDIYPRGLQLLFTLVAPFALTTHLPTAYILDKPLWGAGAGWSLLAPLSGFAFLGLMTFVFYRGLRRYRSTGS